MQDSVVGCWRARALTSDPRKAQLKPLWTGIACLLRASAFKFLLVCLRKEF